MMSSSCVRVRSLHARHILALHAQRSSLSMLEEWTAHYADLTEARTMLDALWWLPRHPWLAVVLDLHVEPAIPVTPLLAFCRHLAPTAPILAFSPRPPDHGVGREHGCFVIVGAADLAHASSFLQACLASCGRADG